MKSSDGGDTFDPMEARVTALEAAFGRIDAKLDAIGKDVSEMKGKVSNLDGKVSNLPSAWQVVTLNATLIAIVLASVGTAFAIIRQIAH